MEFETQLTEIKNDLYIKNYFQNKNLQDFIKSYIQVDTLINNKQEDLEPTKIFQQLSNIQTSIKQLDIKSNIQECLTYTTNTQIKNILIDLNHNKEQNLKSTLDNFKDSIINLNSQNLNEFDRKSLNIIQNIQSSFSNSLDSHNISHKINSIDTVINSLYNTFTNNSSKKGELAENILCNNLIKAFPSSDVTNTSQISNSGDIMIKKEGKPDILIDSKHFQTNVPKLDLEKFIKDCELNNCSGILCNVNSGIANKEHFQIDIVDSRIYVYISNHEFDNTLFQLAAKIIYNIYDIIKSNKTNIIEIDKELFERIKIEYNFYIQSFKQHLNIIKQNINSLEQLAMLQLEQFFKRSNFNDLKPFPCLSCGAGFGSSKTLKKHMKDKHEITITTPRKPRIKKENPEEQPETPEETPEKQPEETSEETSEETPEETPQEQPEETPQEQPEETPEEQPEEQPEEYIREF
jgi:hypothetical protein